MSEGAQNQVSVRYFAAARAAAGVEQEEVTLDGQLRSGATREGSLNCSLVFIPRCPPGNRRCHEFCLSVRSWLTVSR